MGKTNRLGVFLTVAGAALVAVGLVVLMLVVEARPAEATFPGNNGKIAYVGVEALPSGYSETEIYTVKAGGGGRFRVTHNATHEELPSYSPSGKKITYNVFGANGWEIYTINAAGGKPFQLTHNRKDELDPDYSPDGKKIAYANIDRRKPGDDWEIYTTNATGGKPFQVTHNNKDDYEPSYSPDGKKIAYVHGTRSLGIPGSPQRHDGEIYTINATGGKPFQITHNNKFDWSPTYSPDGKKIAYESDGMIYTINPGGGGKTKVTEGSDPSWSPNGKKIAYENLGGHFDEIFTINLTGWKPFQVTHNNKDDWSPSYSPDGKKIAYSSRVGYQHEIFTINATGGKPFQVTHNKTDEGDPSWGSRP